MGGSRTDQDGDAMQWALRGYVAVSIDYRLANIANAGNNNEATLAAAAIPDREQSIRWLKANAATYGIDTTRMGIIGFSAGGAKLSLGVDDWCRTSLHRTVVLVSGDRRGSRAHRGLPDPGPVAPHPHLLGARM